jgi:protein O-GlcNAc transferase
MNRPSLAAVLLPLLLSAESSPAVPDCSEARARLRSGRPAQALELLADASGLDCLALRGQAAFALGRYETASADYASALRLQPQHAGLHFNLGLAQLKSSQLVLGAFMLEGAGARAALDSFRRAVHLEPTHLPALHHVALALELLQRDDEAEAAHRRCLQVAPTHAESRRQLGTLLLRSGRTEEAEAELRQARALDVGDAVAAQQHGKALMRLGRNEAALAAARAAVLADERSAPSWYLLSTLLDRVGRPAEASEARARFEALGRDGLDREAMQVAAIGLDEGSRAQLYFVQALQEEQAGKLREAAELLQKALALDGSLPEGNFRLGLLRLRQGDFVRAEEALRAELHGNPGLAPAHFYLAAILDRSGKTREAIASLERAAALDPSAKATAVQLARLRSKLAGEPGR